MLFRSVSQSRYAAAYRAIETTNGSGYSIYTGAAQSYFGGSVGIGQVSPSYSLDISSTGGMRIPVGTEAQRPTGANGVMRVNTDDSGALEWYSNTNWNSVVGTRLAAGKFTANRIPYSDANGYLTESSNMTVSGGNYITLTGSFSGLSIVSSSPYLIATSNSSLQGQAGLGPYLS